MPSQDNYLSKSIFLNTYDALHSLKIQKNIIKIIEKEVGKKSIIIDVGANIGNVVIPFVKNYNFDSALAIEPSLNALKFLRTNLILNEIDDKVKIFDTCLTDTVAPLIDFIECPHDLGDGRIKVENNFENLFGENNRKKIKLKNSTIDKLFLNFDLKNSIIWINNQGSEGLTLYGGRKILKKFKPPTLIEFGPYFIQKTNSYEKLVESIKTIYNKIYDPIDMKLLGYANNFDFRKKYEQLGLKGDYCYFLLI